MKNQNAKRISALLLAMLVLEKVTVLAGNRIKVTFRNGVEIEQTVDQPKRRKFA